MAQSQNSSVDLTIPATSFQGMDTYGNMMAGNKAVEFYNERNPEDFIQIPWDQIDHVAASVICNKRIVRFAIFTKENGSFSFSTRDNKKTLRAFREYLGDSRLVRSPSLVDVLKAGVCGLFRRG